MEEVVKYIVVNLVEFPDDVEITSEKDGNLTIIKIKTNENDLGRIIGKGGKIINSIRTIVRSFASREDGKVIVKVG